VGIDQWRVCGDHQHAAGIARLGWCQRDVRLGQLKIEQVRAHYFFS
jgi:hypothetical protein